MVTLGSNTHFFTPNINIIQIFFLFFKYFCEGGASTSNSSVVFYTIFFIFFYFLPYPGYPRIGLPENWMPDSVRTFTCCLVSEIQTLGLFSPYFSSVNPEDFLKETMNFYMPMLFSSRPA